MLLVAMRKLCRVGIAAVVATALCVLTLVDMPPQLPEPPTDPPPTPAREPPGTRSIVAYSWARRLALDYRPSRDCGDDGGDRSGFFDGTPEESRSSSSSSSSASNASRVTSNSSISNSSNSSSSSSSWSGGSTDSKSWWLETIPRRLFLYSAHLDIRVAGYPSVRVIGVKREPAPPLLSSGKLFCTIWHEDSEGRTKSFSMEALVSYIWLDEWGGTSEGHTGILVNCHLPRSAEGRLRVHVGPTFCHQNPSHSLLVNGPATSSAASDSAETAENKTTTTATPLSSLTDGGGEKNRFTLCIKGLDFDEDISERLVAFVELNRILGAGTMYVYVFHVHANVSRVLRMYEKSNVVRWFPLSLPGDLPNDATARRRLFAKDVWMKRRMELIPYNHCFYENLYSSEFVVPIDIDETIIPVRRRAWSQLIADERSRLGGSFENYASYAVRNVYFFPEFQRRQREPSDEPRSSTGAPAKSTSAAGGTDSGVDADAAAHYYLDTVRTAAVSPEGDSVKSFVSTKRALTVHNHYALTTLDPTTRRAHHFDPRDALKHHHRACDDRHLDCDLATQDLRVDESATRYADELATRVKIALARLDEIA